MRLEAAAWTPPSSGCRWHAHRLCSFAVSLVFRPLWGFFFWFFFLPWFFPAVLWAAAAVVTTKFRVWTHARMVAALGVAEWRLSCLDSSCFLPAFIAVRAPTAWSCHGRILREYCECQDGPGLALHYGPKFLSATPTLAHLLVSTACLQFEVFFCMGTFLFRLPFRNIMLPTCLSLSARTLA